MTFIPFSWGKVSQIHPQIIPNTSTLGASSNLTNSQHNKGTIRRRQSAARAFPTEKDLGQHLMTWDPLLSTNSTTIVYKTVHGDIYIYLFIYTIIYIHNIQCSWSPHFEFFIMDGRHCNSHLPMHVHPSTHSSSSLQQLELLGSVTESKLWLYDFPCGWGCGHTRKGGKIGKDGKESE